MFLFAIDIIKIYFHCFWASVAIGNDDSGKGKPITGIIFDN